MRRRDLLLALAGATALRAQRDSSYDRSVVKQTRIDLRNLGYPPEDLIPSDESAIRALAVAPDGAIYGATSGKRSHLFMLSPQHGYVQPLGVLPGVSTVHRSVVVSTQGEVFIGGSIGVDNGGGGYENYAGGHLLKYAHRNDEQTQIRIGHPLAVTDLGAPVAGDGIYSLAIDRKAGTIYGLTYPHGHFFSYDLSGSRFHAHGQVATERMPGEKFENEYAIGRALAIDDDGIVFTSGQGGRLCRLVPSSGALESLNLYLPGVLGREVYNRVDAWAAADGMLYGGTSDGYLFRLDPKALHVENLGKPLNQARIRGLAFAGGKLYGAGGDDDEMARLFSYDPARGVYEILGMIDVNHRPYYAWQAYVVDALAAGTDGALYIGQAERKSNLYIYYPESK
jgi:hypothetical protein